LADFRVLTAEQFLEKYEERAETPALAAAGQS
jgi:hypothetical protein